MYEQDGYAGEEIGMVDLVGEVGLNEIVGDAVKKVLAQARRPQQQRPAGLPPGATIRKDQNSIARRQISPIPLTTIAAGATEVITWRPQRPIRVERLVVDASVANGVFITDFTVGAEPQFVNQGAVPTSAFAANAFGTELQGNTASPGIDITLVVRNTTGGAASVGGMVIGTSLT